MHNSKLLNNHGMDSIRHFSLLEFNQKNLPFVLFGLIFLLEFLLFKRYVLNEIVPYFPIGYDQTGFLQKSYEAYERVLSQGLIAGFRFTTTANSVLFIPQAVIFFLLFGATRLTALSINFFYFIVLQISLIYTFKWLCNRYSIGFVAVGLLLTSITPFFWHGNITDFRIDFIAFCLYGIFSCSVIRSEIFLNRTWTLIAAAIACFMMLMRSLTSVYIFLIIGSFFSFLTLSIYLTKNKKSLNNYNIQNKTRLKNIILFSFILLAAMLPFLWLNKSIIFNYYVTHGMIKEAQFRNVASHTGSLAETLQFYPNILLIYHIGTLAKKMVFLLVTSAILIVFAKKIFLSSQTDEKQNNLILYPNIFLLLSIFLPILILTVYPSKSDCVGTIVLIPLLLFIMLNSLVHTKIYQYRKIMLLFSFIFLTFGCLNWIKHLNQHNFLKNQNAINITKMYNDIGQYIESAQWDKVNYSTDQVSEHLAIGNLATLYYENKGILFNNLIPLLGQSNYPYLQNEVENMLNRSDVFIAHEGEFDPSEIPFNIAIRPLIHNLKSLATKQFIHLGNYFYKNEILTVFVKPSFIISGASNDWITEDGISLRISNKVAKNASQLILSGDSEFRWLPKKMFVYAQSIDDLGNKIPINTSFLINGNHYTIICALPDKLSTIKNDLTIHLTFSDYFIPAKAGINQDQRKLVIQTPTSKKVVLRNSSFIN